jgi:polar amino acid transport system substrate-binding protein
MNISRLIVIITAVFALLINDAYAVDGSPTISRIMKTGKLVLGTSGNMPLMSEQTEKGNLIGFDIDLAQALAESMNVKLETKVLPFEELIPALESNKVDVVLSNMTMTTDRNMRVAFAGPYFVSGKCIITREATVADAENAEELQLSDITMVVIKGTTSENFVKQHLPQMKRSTVTDVDEGIKKIADDEAEAMLTDFPVCLSVLRQHPNSGFQSELSLLTYEPIGIALPADDPLFSNLAKNFLLQAETLGVMETLTDKWFSAAPKTSVADK